MTSMTSTTNQPTHDNGTGASAPDDGGGAVTRVASEAPAQAARVFQDTRTQLSDAAHRSFADVRGQAEERTTQASQVLRDLSTQVDALVAGQPEESGSLTGIVQALGESTAGLADRLDANGLDGVVDDLSRFGRQHPWAFLGLSLGAGFLAGRLVRTTAAVASDGDLSSSSTPAATPSSNGAQLASAGRPVRGGTQPHEVGR